jgi:hypothetical protein
MRGGLTVPDLAELLIPYLTASEAVKLVAQSFTRVANCAVPACDVH